ncbi:unnamed protein product, partial [Effrenium voratum]
VLPTAAAGIPQRVLNFDQVENVMQRVNMDTLKCWASHISQAQPGLLRRVMAGAA